jgi:hypothetical protein
MNYPVFIDEKNEINRLNHFPTLMEYQCFLLDKDNKVLLIGNPTLNLRIWEMYKQVITGEITNKTSGTTVDVYQTKMELTDLHINKTSEAGNPAGRSGLFPQNRSGTLQYGIRGYSACHKWRSQGRGNIR